MWDLSAAPKGYPDVNQGMWIRGSTGRGTSLRTTQWAKLNSAVGAANLVVPLPASTLKRVGSHECRECDEQRRAGRMPVGTADSFPSCGDPAVTSSTSRVPGWASDPRWRRGWPRPIFPGRSVDRRCRALAAQAATPISKVALPNCRLNGSGPKTRAPHRQSCTSMVRRFLAVASTPTARWCRACPVRRMPRCLTSATGCSRATRSAVRCLCAGRRSLVARDGLR